MTNYIDKFNYYTHPAMNGDQNWDIDQFIGDVHIDPENRIYVMPEDMRLENGGLTHGKEDILSTFLLTRKKFYKIIKTYEHHIMSRPRFEEDIGVATCHVILITKPPYEGEFKEVDDNKWFKARNNLYKDYILYYNSYGYTVDIDYWLPRLRQYLRGRYY